MYLLSLYPFNHRWCFLTSPEFGHMLSVGAIHFEDRFCASKKGGIRGGGRVPAWSNMHITATLASYRIALVGTGWTISHLVSTNRLRNHSSPLVGAPFFDLRIGGVQSGGALADWRALTIESSLWVGVVMVLNLKWLFQRSFSSSFQC